MVRVLLNIILLLTLATTACAQDDRQGIRRGNRLYRKSEFALSETEYRKAVSERANNPQAIYNLGCALMMQEKDSLAVDMFKKAAQLEPTPRRRALAFHNIGVIFQNRQAYAEAIEAYAQSLRNNPGDDETRYNLALCQKLLKQRPSQQNQQGGGGNGDQKDKKQDEKGKNDNKKDQNDDNNKHQDPGKRQDDAQPQEPYPGQGEMSKDVAEQLLKAALQKEKDTQERVKKAQRNKTKPKKEINRR